jgi:hypothetical protein
MARVLLGLRRLVPLVFGFAGRCFTGVLFSLGVVDFSLEVNTSSPAVGTPVFLPKSIVGIPATSQPTN